MIKVTVLYPKIEGGEFDFDYYLNTHMPRSIELLGPHMRSIIVERGVNPGEPWPDAQYVAIASFVCGSKEAYESAFLPHAAELQGDIAHYTNIEPIIQISEISIDH